MDQYEWRTSHLNRGSNQDDWVAFTQGYPYGRPRRPVALPSWRVIGLGALLLACIGVTYAVAFLVAVSR
jgi:hypothetical protein